MTDRFAAHLADFRKSKHVLFAHLSFYVGRKVYEGELITPFPPTYPVVYLMVDPTFGDIADVRAGFRVDIYDSTGTRFKGRTRVRFGQPLVDGAIPIRETSKGSIAFTVGDIVRVYRDPRLSYKLPTADSTFSPDGTAYTDQGSNPPPLPCSGGAWAGWTRMLPAVMTGSASTVVDPDSGDDPTHDWSETDGLTISSGLDTDADIELTGDAGEYLVEHVVTDPDNGKSITQYVPVVIHDQDHPPYRVKILDLPDDEEHGGSARVQMLGHATLDDVPDGALAILWKEEFIAGSRQSFGAKTPGRSHILMVGYLRREEGDLDGESGTESLEFEIISPLARLDELMGYSKVMLESESPDSWSLVKQLSVWRGIIQDWLFYTTGSESGFDLIKTSTFQDELYSGHFLQTSTPLKQMRELADATDGRLIEDRRGRFEVQMRPELVALSNRASDLTVTLTLTKRDIKKLHYTREHWRSVNRIEVRGFTAGLDTSDNLPLFSEWVGQAPGEGNYTSTIERKIISAANSQTVLNERAGRLGAAQDGIYVDSDGGLQRALDLEITLRGVYDLFDFYDEVVNFNIQTTRRGLDLSDQSFVYMGSTRSLDNGTLETVARFRTCTNGAEGHTFVPPQANDIPVPITTLPAPQPIVLPDTFGSLIARGTADMALICTNGLALTDSFTRTAAAGGPVYTAATLTSLGVSGTVLLWCPDPASPGSGWLFTTTKIFYVVLATATITDLFSWTNTAQSVSADASFNTNDLGFVGAAAYSQGHGTYAAVATDGMTFSESLIDSHYATDGASFGINCGFCIPSHGTGKAITSVYSTTAAAAAALCQGKITTNHGGSWGDLSTPLIDTDSNLLAQQIHFPWNGNSSELLMYYTAIVASSDHRLRRVNGGATTDITPVISGNKYAPRQPRDGIQTSVQNRLRVVTVAQRGGGNHAGFLSNDGGDHWNTILGDGTNARHIALSGDDPNTGWVWGTSNFISQMTISGTNATFDSRTGNLASLSIGDIIAIAGV